jgi:hypothetical protein
MRLTKAWIIATKDFKIFKNKRSILYSIIGFQVLVSIVLPLIIQFAGAKTGGISVDVLPRLIDAFSFWFVIGATVLPISIASY